MGRAMHEPQEGRKEGRSSMVIPAARDGLDHKLFCVDVNKNSKIQNFVLFRCYHMLLNSCKMCN
jgi:hypothetical protein